MSGRSTDRSDERAAPDPSRPARTGTVLESGRDPGFAERPSDEVELGESKANDTARDGTAGDGTAPGRTALKPSDFTWSDWKAILKRTASEISSDNVSLISAGVAFYAMLALFPGIAALVALYGVVADPVTIQDHLATLSRLMPPEAFEIVETQVKAVASAGPTTLGLTSILSLGVALWSSKAGVSALMTGLNVVYDEDDGRGFITALLIALGLTLLLLAVVLVAIGVVVVAPMLLDLLPLGPVGTWIAAILRWPVVILAVILAIGALYRWGPSRADAQIAWISWGAAIATAIWLVGSLLFSLYVANFASYNETYGALGAVMALLMWFYMSAFIVLLGAELNAEMEHHTGRDTTTGPPRPMGERGAHVADTVPEG